MASGAARVPTRWPIAFITLCTLIAAVFLALPWSLETKSLAALHGLCAQQPTHSFYFDDARLPFDARMSGIYGGFAITSLVLLALRRWRTSGIPSVPLLVVLGSFIVVMGIDGVNSTLVDLRRWHLYEPRNELRLVTGQLTGVTLATFVWLLVGQIGFASAARRAMAPLRGFRDLAIVLTVQLGFTLLVVSGWGPLRVPLTLLLIGAAVAAVTGLTLGFVLLFSQREGQALTTSALVGPATIALVVALIIIGSLGGGRFLLEAWLNIPSTLPELQSQGFVADGA